MPAASPVAFNSWKDLTYPTSTENCYSNGQATANMALLTVQEHGPALEKNPRRLSGGPESEVQVPGLQKVGAHGYRVMKNDDGGW